jgi:molybdopterin-guanine dinucleotide biosynthesis protein A
MTTPSAIILAGGRSSRMGLPKAALPFGASTILERLIDALSGFFAEIIVVAAPLSDEPFSIDHTLKRRADAGFETNAADAAPPGSSANLKHHTNLIIERDEAAFAGPVGALRRGLDQARGAIAFACSCDLPLLRSDLAVALCATLEGPTGAVPETPFDAAIPSIEGFMQPLCAAYRREPAIAALLTMEADGERRLTQLADRLNVNVVDELALRSFDADLRSFLNVNTADDYARALRLARTA